MIQNCYGKLSYRNTLVQCSSHSSAQTTLPTEETIHFCEATKHTYIGIHYVVTSASVTHRMLYSGGRLQNIGSVPMLQLHMKQHLLKSTYNKSTLCNNKNERTTEYQIPCNNIHARKRYNRLNAIHRFRYRAAAQSRLLNLSGHFTNMEVIIGGWGH